MPAQSRQPDPVELVRRALNARRSEFGDLLAPDVRLDLSERVFNPTVYEGYEGIIRWRAEVKEVWESYTSEPEECFAGDDVVVVFTREIGRGGRGAGSGVEVDRRTALLFQIRAGRVSAVRLYHDRNEAMRDARLAQ
jgi:ketosteroid isomerase-like protein